LRNWFLAVVGLAWRQQFAVYILERAREIDQEKALARDGREGDRDGAKTPGRSNLDMIREPLPNRWMSRRSGSAHTMIVQRQRKPSLS
jgi:hypothetical protein